ASVSCASHSSSAGTCCSSTNTHWRMSRSAGVRDHSTTWTRGSVIVILVLAVLLGEQIPFAEQLLQQLHGFSVIAPGCQLLGAPRAPDAAMPTQGAQVQRLHAAFATGTQHQVVLLLPAPRQSRAPVAHQRVAAAEQLAQQSAVQFLRLDKLRVTPFRH